MRGVAARIIAWMLVAAWMVMIFCMSAQPAGQSTGTSGRVIRLVAGVIVPGFSEMTADEQAQCVTGWQHLARKTAHFAEYTMLGVLLTAGYATVVRRNRRWWLALITGALYAAGDEVYQLFVPGRSCQLTDVLLDSCGVAAGVVLALLLMQLVRRIARTARRRRECATAKVV